MKRIVQILVTVAFVAPLVHAANAETMAERKQRIMRKYLRERRHVTQSDMEVPQTSEDERVKDSEKYQQLKVDLSRKHKSVAAPASMPAARPMPVQARKSWWADDAAGSDTDPYADPFADKSADKSTDTKSDWWTTEWKSRQEEMAKKKQSDTPGAYNYSGAGSYYPNSSGYGYTGQQQNRYSGYGYGYGSQNNGSGYGQRSYYNTGSGNGQLSPYGTSRYGSSPSGMLQQPYSTQQGSDDPRHTPSSGYTPYKSPYQNRYETRQKQQQTTPQQKKDFSRPTPYQQWKKDNKAWNPAADDSYVDELMKRDRK